MPFLTQTYNNGCRFGMPLWSAVAEGAQSARRHRFRLPQNTWDDQPSRAGEKRCRRFALPHTPNQARLFIRRVYRLRFRCA
jgi:hypothetical protein